MSHKEEKNGFISFISTWLIVYLLTFFIIVVSLIPLRGPEITVKSWDKITHFVMYGILSLMMLRALVINPVRKLKKRIKPRVRRIWDNPIANFTPLERSNAIAINHRRKKSTIITILSNGASRVFSNGIKGIKRFCLISFFYAFLLGFFLEVAQVFLPYRCFELWDVLSNFLGSIAGVFMGKRLLVIWYCQIGYERI